MLRESNESEDNLTLFDYLPQEPVDMVVILTVIATIFYYLWRATYLTPWYDELYTYYYFISRGPVYAATHWPLTNNHVGYSVLSSLLDYFGNPYVGLRGISFICSVLNPILVYRIARRYFEEWYAYGSMVMYFSCMLVNDLSIQGRGYTLACTCFLISLRQIIIICGFADFRVRDYLILSVALILGAYTIPSSIYWIVPTCIAALVFLLINGIRSFDSRTSVWNTRYFKKLKNFLVTVLVSAVITFLLYLMIWLAVGSNLLVKEEGGLYYGMKHIELIMAHPISAAKQGFDYMLSKPYIHNVSRNGFLDNFVNWSKALAGCIYPEYEILTIAVVIFAFILLLAECIRHFEISRTIFNLLMITNIIGFPIMLILQSRLPYYRIFSYVCVVTSICFAYVLEHLSTMLRFLLRKNENYTILKSVLRVLPVLMMFGFSIIMIVRPDYYTQYGIRETDCYNALYIAHPSENKKLCVLDCDQQYLLKFGWGIDCDNTDVEDCDYILIDRDMMTEGYIGSDFWKFYLDYNSIPWNYINSNYFIFYENEDFVLYKR